MAYSWLLARLQVLQNSGSQMSILRVKTLLVQDHQIEEKEKYFFVQQYKGASVSALTGSVPRKMA